MDVIYQQLVERNERETIPFKCIYSDYMTLLQSYTTLEKKFYRNQLHHKWQQPTRSTTGSSSSSSRSTKDKKDDALTDNTYSNASHTKIHSDPSITNTQQQTEQDEHQRTVQDLQVKMTEQTNTIIELHKQIEQLQSRAQRFQQQVQEHEINTTLLQEQNDQLKTTLRSLHNNYDTIQMEQTKMAELHAKEKEELLQTIQKLRSSTTSNDLSDMKQQPQQQNATASIPPPMTTVQATSSTISPSSAAPSSFTSSALSWFTSSSGGNNKKEAMNPTKHTYQTSQTDSHTTTSTVVVPVVVPTPTRNSSVALKDSGTNSIGSFYSSSVSRSSIHPVVCTVPKTIHQTMVVTNQQQQPQQQNIGGKCVRYDRYLVSNSQSTGAVTLIATLCTDGTTKIWQQDHQTSALMLRSSLRVIGGSSTSSGSSSAYTNSTIGFCDVIHQHYLVNISNYDKSCRIWDIRRKNQERMIHQLVGHTNKITCVRLFYHVNDKAMVITGSSDKTLRIWDISRTTYQQVMTLHYPSTSTCIDIGLINDRNSTATEIIAVTGHMDGGIRIWNIQSGKLISDLSVLHESGISSVQFQPNDTNQVLSCSIDSTMKIVDIRTLKVIHIFCHSSSINNQGIPTSSNSPSYHQHWSYCCTFSPDGRYVASGSTMNGTILIWDTTDRFRVKAQISSHQSPTTGISSLDWWYYPLASTTSATITVGGITTTPSSEQQQEQQEQYQHQLAALDRKGTMTLWS